MSVPSRMRVPPRIVARFARLAPARVSMTSPPHAPLLQKHATNVPPIQPPPPWRPRLTPALDRHRRQQWGDKHGDCISARRGDQQTKLQHKNEDSATSIPVQSKASE